MTALRLDSRTSLADIKAQLAAGASPNERVWFYAPLELAAWHGRADVVELLLAAGAVVDDGFVRAFEEAARHRHGCALEALLGRASPQALTAGLNQAASSKDLALMKHLVAAGARPDGRTVCYAATSPYAPQATTHAECIAVLRYALDPAPHGLGLDPNDIADDFGASPLFQALEWGDDVVIDLLLAHGAQLADDESECHVPLSSALRAIAAGVSPNALLRNAVRAHALPPSAEERIALARVALAYGADPNASGGDDDGGDGPPPFLVALAVGVGCSDLEFAEWVEPILELQLAHRADPALVLRDGYDPYRDEDHFRDRRRRCLPAAAGATVVDFLAQQPALSRARVLLAMIGPGSSHSSSPLISADVDARTAAQLRSSARGSGAGARR